MKQLNRFVQTFGDIYQQWKNTDKIDSKLDAEIEKDLNTTLRDEEQAAIVQQMRELYFLDEDYIDIIREHAKNKRKIQFADGTQLFIYSGGGDSRNGIMSIEENLVRDMKKYYILLRDYLNSGLFTQMNPLLQVRPLTIHYYPLRINKQFPTTGEKMFTPRHVNTGCTFIESGTIYLWRQEEIVKVMIHELMHAWKFDYGIIKIQDKQIHPKIKKHTIIKDSININEAYNELWAEIIQLIFYSFDKSNRAQGDKDRTQIDRMIKRQNTYNFYQIGRIYEWTGIRNWKNIFIHDKTYSNSNSNSNSNNRKRRQLTQFPQNTNVFSYYCLKRIIWNKLEQFLDNVEKWSKNGGNRGNISANIANYFYKELEESVKNGDLFYKRLNHIIKIQNSTNADAYSRTILSGLDPHNFRMMYIPPTLP